MKNRDNVTHEYKMINTKDIRVDDFYQRGIRPNQLMKIVREFDMCLVNAPKLSFRDGKYYVYDGQTTTAALKTVLGKGKDLLIECKVFYGLTRADEVELFLKQNGIVDLVQMPDRLKALYNNGDEDVHGMIDDARRAGVFIDSNFSKGQGRHKIVAYAEISRLYVKLKAKNRLGEYIDMLHVIDSAWDGDPNGFVREILRGMAKFYSVYYGDFESKHLINSLSRISPLQIVREGKSLISGSSTDTGYARIILQAYNHGRNKNRMPDKL